VVKSVFSLAGEAEYAQLILAIRRERQANDPALLLE